MFRNKESVVDMTSEEKTTRSPETYKPANTGPTQIAYGAEIHGELKTPGQAIIEGRLEGTLCAEGDVQVGPKGHIVGEVVGKNITVAGTVSGKIYADDKAVLVSGSRLEGDIHSQSLKIEDAVFFQGGCAMGPGARKRWADANISLPRSLQDLKAA